MSERIKKVFSDKKKKLITFVTGGDPDKKTSQKILEKIVECGSVGRWTNNSIIK